MILLILLGCASVGHDSQGTDVFESFMQEERTALGVTSTHDKIDDQSLTKAVDEINQDFLAWMTLQNLQNSENVEEKNEQNFSNARSQTLKASEEIGYRQNANTTIENNTGNTLPAPQATDLDEAWEENRGQQPERPRVKVGVLLPITGTLSKIGLHLWHSALLALHQYQGDDDVTLYLFDTMGDPIQAKNVFLQALRSDVDVILGPFLSSNLEEIRDLIVRDVPVLSFSNNNQYAGEGVYIFGYTPLQQLSVLVDYAQHKGKKKLGVLLPKTLYGKEIKHSLDLVLQEEGISYEKMLVYDPSNMEDDTNLKQFADYDNRRFVKNRALRLARENALEEEIEHLEKRDTLGEAPFDSLLLVATNEIDLRTLSAKLSFFDVDFRNGVQFLGLQGWEDFNILNREPSLVGSWYVAPPRKNRKVFEEAFRNFYKEEPLRLAALAFELVLLVNSLSTDILAGVELSQALENPSGFVGIEGNYRFLENGRVERMMNVLRITNRGEVVEEEALPSFSLWDRRMESKAQQENTSLDQ